MGGYVSYPYEPYTSWRGAFKKGLTGLDKIFSFYPE
jgi:hypothetical protein